MGFSDSSINQHGLLASSLLKQCHLILFKYDLSATTTIDVKLLVVVSTCNIWRGIYEQFRTKLESALDTYQAHWEEWENSIIVIIIIINTVKINLKSEICLYIIMEVELQTLSLWKLYPKTWVDSHKHLKTLVSMVSKLVLNRHFNNTSSYSLLPSVLKE